MKRPGEALIWGVIAAAGEGRRMGLGQNKVLYSLAGLTPLERVCQLLEKSSLAAYVVMLKPEEIPQVTNLFPAKHYPKLRALLPGGASRQASVRAGLEYWEQERQQLACPEVRVLVHDAARCLLSSDLLERIIDLGRHSTAAIAPALPIRDSVRSLLAEDGQTRAVDREALRLVQTPQMADLSILLQALRAGREAGQLFSDELSALEWIGYPIQLIEGERRNFKLTDLEDLRLAELWLQIPELPLK